MLTNPQKLELNSNCSSDDDEGYREASIHSLTPQSDITSNTTASTQLISPHHSHANDYKKYSVSTTEDFHSDNENNTNNNTASSKYRSKYENELKRARNLSLLINSIQDENEELMDATERKVRKQVEQRYESEILKIQERSDMQISMLQKKIMDMSEELERTKQMQNAHAYSPFVNPILSNQYSVRSMSSNHTVVHDEFPDITTFNNSNPSVISPLDTPFFENFTPLNTDADDVELFGVRSRSSVSAHDSDAFVSPSGPIEPIELTNDYASTSVSTANTANTDASQEKKRKKRRKKRGKHRKHHKKHHRKHGKDREKDKDKDSKSRFERVEKKYMEKKQKEETSGWSWTKFFSCSPLVEIDEVVDMDCKQKNGNNNNNNKKSKNKKKMKKNNRNNWSTDDSDHSDVD